MAGSRKRRIIKCAAWTLAVVVWLVAYVAGYRIMNWYDGYGALDDQPLRGIVKVAYLPLDIYCGTGLPGAEWLAIEAVASHWDGGKAAVADWEANRESSVNHADRPTDQD